MSHLWVLVHVEGQVIQGRDGLTFARRRNGHRNERLCLGSAIMLVPAKKDKKFPRGQNPLNSFKVKHFMTPKRRVV